MSMVPTGNRLWKSVENFSEHPVAGVVDERRLHAASYCAPGVSQRSLSACSACPGDYEDPDRTAWTLEPEDDDGDETFPLESQRGGTSNTPDDVDRNDDEFPARNA
jgi:hypothetical protein